MKEKLSKDEFWDELDPDKLNLSKKDLLEFFHRVLDEWNLKNLTIRCIHLSANRLYPPRLIYSI